MRWYLKSRRRHLEWHPWFAWFPIKIGMVGVWGETIERRAYFGWDGGVIYDYRLPVKGEDNELSV